MAEYSFKIKKGTDDEKVFSLFTVKDGVKTAFDMTGFTAAMQIRQTPYSPKAIDSFTTSNGKLVIDPTGKITVKFSHKETEQYPVATLVYDIELTNASGEKTRPIHGRIKVLPEVTKIEPNESN
jgi:hypothetical protein